VLTYGPGRCSSRAATSKATRIDILADASGVRSFVTARNRADDARNGDLLATTNCGRSGARAARRRTYSSERHYSLLAARGASRARAWPTACRLPGRALRRWEPMRAYAGSSGAQLEVAHPAADNRCGSPRSEMENEFIAEVRTPKATGSSAFRDV